MAQQHEKAQSHTEFLHGEHGTSRLRGTGNEPNWQYYS